MGFEWRTFSLFGLVMRIPAIRFIIRKSEEHITAFAEVASELNNCDKCHKYCNMHCANAMLQHIIAAHGIEEDRALQIVADLWKRILILIPQKGGNKDEQL